MSERKPKTKSGFASFNMQEFAEMLIIPNQNDKTRVGVDESIKPKQNERQ
mgnify:CR=1 FL=1